MKKGINILLLAIISLVFTQCSKSTDEPEETVVTPAPVTDADGNVYTTIKMGNQVWMKENLKTTKFNDGTPINLWAFGTPWHNATSEAPFYQLASVLDLNKVYATPLPAGYYGALYNHYALSSGKLAPKGWRIPTPQDFIELEAYVTSQGVTGNAVEALKSKIGWHKTTGNGTDVFGFNGLPNGYMAVGGTSTGTESICTWATTEFNPTNKTRKVANLYKGPGISFGDNSIFMGAGVRCIKE